MNAIHVVKLYLPINVYKYLDVGYGKLLIQTFVPLYLKGINVECVCSPSCT